MIVKPGDKITVKGLVIEAVPAYNTNKPFHPRAKRSFPFDGARRLGAYVIDDTVHAVDLVDDVSGDMLEKIPGQPRPVGGHPVGAGDRPQHDLSLIHISEPTRPY